MADNGRFPGARVATAVFNAPMPGAALWKSQLAWCGGAAAVGGFYTAVDILVNKTDNALLDHFGEWKGFVIGFLVMSLLVFSPSYQWVSLAGGFFPILGKAMNRFVLCNLLLVAISLASIAVRAGFDRPLAPPLANYLFLPILAIPVWLLFTPWRRYSRKSVGLIGKLKQGRPGNG